MSCICNQCDLFTQVTCPRVSPDGKEMCLSFQGAQTNSLRQLKAQVAAVVERLQRAYAMRESPDVLDCISELRQLSAV